MFFKIVDKVKGALFGIKLWDFQIGFFASSAGAFFTYALFIAVFALITDKAAASSRKKKAATENGNRFIGAKDDASDTENAAKGAK